MGQDDGAERREHHRLGFAASIDVQRLDDALLQQPEALRSKLRSELRMLQWLALENQYVFVRDSVKRTQPALAPLIRLIDAKLNFLAGEILVETALQDCYEQVHMSATGIDFKWPEDVDPGALCLVRIDPEGTDPALALPAVIQRIEDEHGRATNRVAARFVALTRDETDALASWIVTREARELKQREAAAELD